jgi:DNA-binding transcriptional regulator LsrR (DeoR family)
MSSDWQRHLSGRVSHLHCIRGLTRNQAARRLELSQSVVQRLLKSALDKGLVEIRTADPALSAAGPNAPWPSGTAWPAVVAPAAGEAGIKAALPRSAAPWLSRRIGHDMIIAPGMGTTLRAITGFMRRMAVRGVRTIPLMGTRSKKAVDGSFKPASNPSGILGAGRYAIAAPAVADSTTAKRPLLSESGIKEAPAPARKADLAPMGLGVASGGGSLSKAGYITGGEVAQMASEGAVGELLGYFCGQGARPVLSQSGPRIIGFDLAQIKRRKSVAAVPPWPGPRKAPGHRGGRGPRIPPDPDNGF